MNILVVGAGAVGQVYGRHLALGGTKVSFFVREKYAEEIRRGLVFYPLNRSRPRVAPVRLELAADQVLTSLDEVAKQTWDAVILTMASPALRGDFLPSLAAVVGDATLVSLQPGSEDRGFMLAAFAEERVVAGMITVVSYQAPLPGETVPEPGMAYWFPPMAPAPFSGPPERTRAIVDALKKGGLPSKVGADVPSSVMFPSVVLMTMLTALESVGWSFAELGRADNLKKVHAAATEAFAIMGSASQRRAPLMLRLAVRPFWLRTILALARWVMPLDLEAYMKFHFTKVRAQTRLHMQSFIDQGAKVHYPTNALIALEAGLARLALAGGDCVAPAGSLPERK